MAVAAVDLVPVATCGFDDFVDALAFDARHRHVVVVTRPKVTIPPNAFMPRSNPPPAPLHVHRRAAATLEPLADEGAVAEDMGGARGIMCVHYHHAALCYHPARREVWLFHGKTAQSSRVTSLGLHKADDRPVVESVNGRTGLQPVILPGGAADGSEDQVLIFSQNGLARLQLPELEYPPRLTFDFDAASIAALSKDGAAPSGHGLVFATGERPGELLAGGQKAWAAVRVEGSNVTLSDEPVKPLPRMTTIIALPGLRGLYATTDHDPVTVYVETRQRKVVAQFRLPGVPPYTTTRFTGTHAGTLLVAAMGSDYESGPSKVWHVILPWRESLCRHLPLDVARVVRAVLQLSLVGRAGAAASEADEDARRAGWGQLPYEVLDHIFRALWMDYLYERL